MRKHSSLDPARRQYRRDFIFFRSSINAHSKRPRAVRLPRGRYGEKKKRGKITQDTRYAGTFLIPRQLGFSVITKLRDDTVNVFSRKRNVISLCQRCRVALQFIVFALYITVATRRKKRNMFAEHCRARPARLLFFPPSVPSYCHSVTQIISGSIRYSFRLVPGTA